MTKRLSILGSTGSIGRSTLDVVLSHPDAFEVEALVANSNVALLAEQARAARARLAVTADAARLEELRERLAGSGIACAAGSEAVTEAASRPVDMVMAAIVGAEGLRPTLAAVAAGATIALANKECLVGAGELFMRRVRAAGVRVIPVDSEHSAVFQCLEERNLDRVARITLTASGGPFRTRSLADLGAVTPADALKHPNWSMGRKVTIDSATLMNKGLELIEAFHLFPVGVERLAAVIHPQSIVHSMVAYCDGSVLAQLGVPDMRTPIAAALAHPARIATRVESLDLSEIGTLTFEPIDARRFPAPSLCLSALSRGGSAPTILNAANEVAVAEFLSQRLAFLAITSLVERVLDRAEGEGMIKDLGSLEDVWAADGFARRVAGETARGLQR
jgi:1-deoxy-D-xylulose-5-phosphate reductoisomerase